VSARLRFIFRRVLEQAEAEDALDKPRGARLGIAALRTDEREHAGPDFADGPAVDDHPCPGHALQQGDHR
jgi:hypothetical protein